MAAMTHDTLDHWTFEFVVDEGAVPFPGSTRHILVAREPLYVVNKANLGDRDRRRGSPRWQDVIAFESAIRMSAELGLAKQGITDWPLEARGFDVHVHLEFGDRLVVVDGRKADARRRAKGIPPKPGRKIHTRRDRAATRCDAYGVDSIKAVLDALEGVLYVADEQATSQSSRKSAREGDVVGDRLTITIQLDRTLGARLAD